MNQPTSKSVSRVKKKVKVRINKANPPSKKKSNLPNRTPEQIAEIHAKQEAALELRMTGATYNQIAKSLGYANPSSAKAAVDAVINRTEREAATEVVALDLARLDEYQMRCTHALRQNGDLHQIDRLMRIMEMRYRLLGVSDETIKLMQEKHGITTGGTIVNGNVVMNVHQSPETEEEFIAKMMRAVGANPNSKEARALIQEHDVPLALPMLQGSANEADAVRAVSEELEEEDVVEGEIVEEL